MGQQTQTVLRILEVFVLIKVLVRYYRMEQLVSDE